MVFNTTFYNVSVILWLSVLLVEETRVPGENQRPVASHWQTLSHNVVSSTPGLSGVYPSIIFDLPYLIIIIIILFRFCKNVLVMYSSLVFKQQPIIWLKLTDWE